MVTLPMDADMNTPRPSTAPESPRQNISIVPPLTPREGGSRPNLRGSIEVAAITLEAKQDGLPPPPPNFLEENAKKAEAMRRLAVEADHYKELYKSAQQKATKLYREIVETEMIYR